MDYPKYRRKKSILLVRGDYYVEGQRGYQIYDKNRYRSDQSRFQLHNPHLGLDPFNKQCRKRENNCRVRVCCSLRQSIYYPAYDNNLNDLYFVKRAAFAIQANLSFHSMVATSRDESQNARIIKKCSVDDVRKTTWSLRHIGCPACPAAGIGADRTAAIPGNNSRSQKGFRHR